MKNTFSEGWLRQQSLLNAEVALPLCTQTSVDAAQATQWESLEQHMPGSLMAGGLILIQNKNN